MYNDVFRPRRGYRQYQLMSKVKLIKDYIRARDAHRRAIEEGRRDHEELIRLSLIPADPDKPEQ